MAERVARSRIGMLLAVALVAGCTGGDESTQPSPTPTPPGVQPAAPSPTTEELADVDWLATSWGEVMALGDEDGGSTVEQAVAAWQVAFGPLPDAPPPLPQDVSAPPDGTMALELVARHLDELTPDQLAVVTSLPQLDVTDRDARGGPSETPSASPTAAGPGRVDTTPVLARSSDLAARSLELVAQEDFATPPVRPTPDGSLPPAVVDRGATNDERNEWRELALGYWRQLQTRSGESLPALDNTITFEFMVPDAAHRTGAWTRPYVRRGQPVCEIVLWNARREPEGTKQSVIAHELFHCAMWVWADSTDQHDSLPWWVIEGLASWVGERLGGTSTYSPRWWGQYLCGACDGAWGLPRASYDAIGWWSFLEDRGAALFPALPTLSRSDGPEGSWDDAMALLPDGSAPSALASAATRRGDGPAWTMDGAGAIVGARHVPDRGTLAAGSVVTYHARPLEQRGLWLAAPVDDDPVLVELEARGWGVARWDRGEDVVAAGGDTTRTWCVGDCSCPDGTEIAPGVERAPRSTSGLRLAPAGAFDAESTMSVEVRRPDEACDEEEPDTTEAPGATGRSHGDPHLTSFDGFGLDFQAVGEFVLVDAGDLQVQVRYAPVEAPFPMSRNTALAVRVDDRVVEYGLDGIVVDGAPTEQLDTTTAGGTRVEASEASGLRVQLPDATTVAMTRTLDVVVHLGPERVAAGEVSGLLGDADGDPDDDVALPSGDLLAAPGTLPGYDLLYGDWADAWRITDATSLFTYAPGESTSTHTDRTFPASDTRLADLLEDQRRRAETACRDAGVTAPDLLQACMLDVGTTDDEAWATNAAEAGTLWLAGLLGELSLGGDPGPAPDDALAADLAAAAADCDLATVGDLLDRGAPADGLDEADGEPPLPLVAAVQADGPDCVDVVRALVDAGASAARPQRGTSQPLPALHQAHDPDVLAVLLELGADPDLLSPTELTPLNAVLLLARDRGDSPAPLVEVLLDAGADPDVFSGQAPLIQAADLPDRASVDALVAAGADPDVSYGDGFAPVHAAARQVRAPEELGVLDSLAAAGADLDATEAFGHTPIHGAVLRINVAAVERLVALGADPCVRDDDGRLPGELVLSEEIDAVLPDCD